MTASRVSFGKFVAESHAAGKLVVQPRMGFGDATAMRTGLLRTKHADATTVGTMTIDSYTRVGEHAMAAKALAEGVPLNGFPITAHGATNTRELLDGVADGVFPVQVRHGSARPQEIIAALVAAGLDATEGGPVSYCLPYSRVSLHDAVRHWVHGCELLAAASGRGTTPHMETFGGCMLGQLCPPSMLVAISVLEGLFFTQHGIRSVSLSYAQQTNVEQDTQAVRALRRLAGELLVPGIDWHVVLYTYMGVYPRTPAGANRLLAGAARLAVRSGAARLIVKTTAEAHRIPTIDENVAALELAGAVAAATSRADDNEQDDGGVVYSEARALVDAVLDLDGSLDRAFPAAFRRGHLDIPYCLHADNAGRVRSHIDESGRLLWSDVGSLPIEGPRSGRARLTAAGLLAALSYVERVNDREGSGQMGVDVDEPRGAMVEHGGFLPPSPAEHLSSPVTGHAMRIQQQVLTAVRSFLADEGFIELLPPVIGPVTDPGARGSKQLDVDFYGHRYKVMTSGILYKQAALVGFGKMFHIAPNVRAEPPETMSTGRHLAEFHQIDVEIADASYADARRLAERLLVHVVGHVVRTVPGELAALGRDPVVFDELLSEPFDVLTHREAVARLHGLQYAQSADAEIAWEGEELLSHKASRPFFVIDYPKGSRGFYDRESETEPGLLRNFDLIVPGGYGEIVSGSERENDYPKIISRMRETGENPAKYGWYLDMVRDGIPASAGFGMGLERLTRFLTGLESVWQVNAFPKVPGMAAP